MDCGCIGPVDDCAPNSPLKKSLYHDLFDDTIITDNVITTNTIEPSSTTHENATTTMSVTAAPTIVDNYGGLVNIGNTCYLNAILQALRYTPGLVDFLEHCDRTIRDSVTRLETITDVSYILSKHSSFF